ncbi:DEAD/DEAH box helicase [Rugamonas sp. DEMB1]|uniref:DEAD/DEAH box helicase n=1 Tax=Rugamonas sp. DEMB1 TaxID=3039386 RepID=UPI002447912C|nr:DEAD/DEAH box helicase [Rugamonas sp. DEMB1]WGG51453.1 DEAD/DEAH box helicase [Rugamonas sp. DEMB1]
MSMYKYRPFIQPLINELTTRSKRAALSVMGIAQPSLRGYLSEQLSGQPGSHASMLADPVFEPTFGWTESDTNMAKLSGELLHADLVACMANPPIALAEDYTFPISRSPFAHQLQAWKTLSMKDPRSLVVTSGTGSGKTECFLVPILDRLTRQAEAEGALQGVRALFIYPLNALIASQQNRLDAWTDGFNGRLRYCLYTGNLPDEAKGIQKEYRGQVIDRRTLRSDPPPMLVTNATMLEYMLVRKEDAPILSKSQGKLEWIVLDEAHTHIGSQAAEMALLLRRVMLAFGVLPKNVRFVATSATFGDDEEATRKLKAFLAAMAGVEPNQIYVIHGKRHVPPLSLPAVRPR